MSSTVKETSEYDSSHVQQVGEYYDEWHQKYMDVYGDVIQVYRPDSQTNLLTYLQTSIGLTDGQKIVDAGCGVCAPSVHFAGNLNLKMFGVTISALQVEKANALIRENGLEERVSCIKGDYHLLDELLPLNEHDGVIFLESLGHASNPDMVINAAAKVIKPGGFIYIKDFYPRETDDSELKARIAKTMDNINREYCYNVLDLNQTLSSLRKAGFAIESIKVFDFESDSSVRTTFESQFGIEVFEGGEFVPAEWLEIKCQKLFV